MMECKKALVETDGDLDSAVDLLRKSGQAKADKKSGRVAADGRIVISVDGAREWLDAVGDELVFFVDEATGRGAVLYRRYDGHYGLVTAT